MSRKMLAIVFALVWTGLTLVPYARADADNQAIRFTINQAVEVPGVVIGPGRYELRLMGDGSRIAELWKADGSAFFGFFQTVPVDRSHPDNTKVVLRGSEMQAPKRIEAWFYPGLDEGNEFLYPQPHNAQIAHSVSPQELNR